MQSLAARGVLGQFDYLSTVSGGGYVGSWLSAWSHRHTRGIAGVCEDLARGLTPAAGRRPAESVASGPSCRCGKPPSFQEPEAHEVKYLREYSNYLTPRLGVFSGDTWTVVATYFRNLLLNWLVLVPLMVGLLLLPRLFEAVLLLGGETPPVIGLKLPWSLFGIMLAASVFAITSAVVWLPSMGRPSAVRRNRRSVQKREQSDEEVCLTKPVGRVAVFWAVVLPILTASIINAILIAWSGGQSPLSPAVRFGVAIGLYVLCASSVQLFARRRRPNPPKPLRLYACFIAMGVVAWATVSLVRTVPLFSDVRTHHVASFACFGVPILLAVYLLTITIYVGLTSWDPHPYADEDREWWARLMGLFLFIMVAWMVVTSIALLSPTVLGQGNRWAHAAGLSTVTAVIGLIAGRSAKLGPHQLKQAQNWRDTLAGRLPSLASQLFILLLLALMAVAIEKSLHEAGEARWKIKDNSATAVLATIADHSLRPLVSDFDLKALGSRPRGSLNPHTRLLALTLLVLLAFGAVVFFGLLINVNRLSLHAMYRNRLMRAYLGASRKDREPHPFTGFDPEDNIPMHHLRRRAQFVREDIIDGPESGPGVPPPNPYGRVVKLARLLLEHNTTFARYMWDRMDRADQELLLAEAARAQQARNALADDAAKNLLAGSPMGSARAAELYLNGEKLLEPLLKHLNRLVVDRGLFEESRFHDPAERESEPDIDAAFRHVDSDGSPNLLNRLVLEKECVWDEQTAAGPTRIDLLRGRRPRPPGPFHVVNIALNLVGGRKLAWQQRKAASFTITPLHCGFYRGYRRSIDYAGGITLGTAVTISGAAASPNMGYHSSPAVTFVLTLLNARLGWWLGNPAEIGSGGLARKIRGWFAQFPLASRTSVHRHTYELQSPRHSLRPLFDEAFGRTDEDSEYVYLSDGGHFDNLGLYEMVLRRCHVIVVSDASCDPDDSLADLGNAIRKIRVDLGIPVELKNTFYPRAERFKGTCCVVGKIKYAEVDGKGVEPGTLIYLKASLPNKDPVDVYNYAITSDKFPHETTADQWFTESQFESYRRLGQEIAEMVCGQCSGTIRLSDWVTRVATEFGGPGSDSKGTSSQQPAPAAAVTDAPTARDGTTSKTSGPADGAPETAAAGAAVERTPEVGLKSAATAETAILAQERGKNPGNQNRTSVTDKAQLNAGEQPHKGRSAKHGPTRHTGEHIGAGTHASRVNGKSKLNSRKRGPHRRS